MRDRTIVRGEMDVLASVREHPIRIWNDLDRSGVLIFRMIQSRVPQARPYRMSAEELQGLPLLHPLDAAERRRIEADLRDHSDAPLAPLLANILVKNGWGEQEAQLLTRPPLATTTPRSPHHA